jgi:hypothetical protein
MAEGGSGGADGGEPVECSDLAGTITIGRNHGHHLLVPREDVDRGIETSYDIMGASAHPHTVVLTEADFADIAAGRTVTVTSSTDADHEHEITIACA